MKNTLDIWVAYLIASGPEQDRLGLLLNRALNRDWEIIEAANMLIERQGQGGAPEEYSWARLREALREYVPQGKTPNADINGSSVAYVACPNHEGVSYDPAKWDRCPYCVEAETKLGSDAVMSQFYKEHST